MKAAEGSDDASGALAAEEEQFRSAAADVERARATVEETRRAFSETEAQLAPLQPSACALEKEEKAISARLQELEAGGDGEALRRAASELRKARENSRVTHTFYMRVTHTFYMRVTHTFYMRVTHTFCMRGTCTLRARDTHTLHARYTQ